MILRRRRQVADEGLAGHLKYKGASLDAIAIASLVEEFQRTVEALALGPGYKLHTLFDAIKETHHDK